METKSLVLIIQEKIKCTKDKRLIIAVSGICGSGKSTISSILASNLEEKAIVIPMDGYHLTKKELSCFDNAEEMILRRGAHFTFDSKGFVDLVAKIKSQNEAVVYANGWSHEAGDHLFDAIQISQDTRIIIIEGLHLFLNFEPWCHLNEQLIDICVWVDVPLEVAMERVARRHVETGLSLNIKEAEARVSRNDRLNAEFLLEHRRNIPGLVTVSNL